MTGVVTSKYVGLGCVKKAGQASQEEQASK